MIAAYLVGSFLGALIGTAIVNVFNRFRDRHREKLFLRFVSVTFKDAEKIEAISVAASDKDAMANVERKIRDASRNH